MIVSRLKSIIKVKWKIYFFTLQVLFYRIKNQTSKNVADTTFKLVLIGIWKTFGTANLWGHVTNFLHFLYYDCWKVLSGYSYFSCKKSYIFIYLYIMFIMQTQPHLVCVTNICLPETLKYWVGVQQDQSYLMERRCLISLGWPPF